MCLTQRMHVVRGRVSRKMHELLRVTSEWSHRMESHPVRLLLNLSAFHTIQKSGHQKSGMIVCVVCKARAACRTALSQGVLSSPFEGF